MSGSDSWTLERGLRAARFRGHRFLRSVLQALACAVALVEVPLFLVRHRREVAANREVMVWWLWSFGNTITGLDYAARLYHPNRVSVVFIPHPRSNDYLPACFEHGLDTIVYRSGLLPGVAEADSFRYRLLRLLLHSWGGATGRFHVIERESLYRTLSLAGRSLLLGDEAAGVRRPSYDITGYIRLLRDGVGRPPALPERLRNDVRAALANTEPTFEDRPFVALYLRTATHNESFDSTIRSSGPQENYRAAVRFLTEHGYHVAGGAETDHRVFADIEGYFALDQLAIPDDLVDVYRLTNCALFIGQVSGPSCLPASCGIPALIADGLAHHRASLRGGDLVLFKHLRLGAGTRVLSLVEVFTAYPDLALGFRFAELGVQIVPNGADEILAATREAVALVEDTLELSDEDRVLRAAFAAMIPREMLVAYEDNRPPLFVLRENRAQLLERGAVAEASRSRA
ncbi:MAG: TIGR04372 family glycosyltransferase [Solirubrobacteraceae bacterium]